LKREIKSACCAIKNNWQDSAALKDANGGNQGEDEWQHGLLIRFVSRATYPDAIR